MKRFSVVLAALAVLAAGLWTLLSAVMVAFDDECAYQRGSCDHTAELIGIALPAWIALGLILVACSFALAKQPRAAWLLILSSVAPLVLIEIPDASYVINQLLTVVWLSIMVLAGLLTTLVRGRRPSA